MTGHSSLGIPRAGLGVQAPEGTKVRVVPDPQERRAPERHGTCCIPLAPIHLYFRLLMPQSLLPLLLGFSMRALGWGVWTQTLGSFLKRLLWCFKVLTAHLWLSSVHVLQW